MISYRPSAIRWADRGDIGFAVHVFPRALHVRLRDTTRYREMWSERNSTRAFGPIKRTPNGRHRLVIRVGRWLFTAAVNHQVRL